MIANAVKKAVKPLNKKRKLNPNKDLQAFEELSISDSEASASSHDSDNSEWKTGSDERTLLSNCSNCNYVNCKPLSNKCVKHDLKKRKIKEHVFSTLDQCINTSHDCNSIMSQLTGRPKYSNKSNNNKSIATAPIVFAKVFLNKKRTKFTYIKILLDSGASSSIAHERLFRKLKTYVDNSTVWNTMAGTLSTSKRSSLNTKMQNLSRPQQLRLIATLLLISLIMMLS